MGGRRKGLSLLWRRLHNNVWEDKLLDKVDETFLKYFAVVSKTNHSLYLCIYHGGSQQKSFGGLSPAAAAVVRGGIYPLAPTSVRATATVTKHSSSPMFFNHPALQQLAGLGAGWSLKLHCPPKESRVWWNLNWDSAHSEPRGPHPWHQPLPELNLKLTKQSAVETTCFPRSFPYWSGKACEPTPFPYWSGMWLYSVLRIPCRWRGMWGYSVFHIPYSTDCVPYPGHIDHISFSVLCTWMKFRILYWVHGSS